MPPAVEHLSPLAVDVVGRVVLRRHQLVRQRLQLSNLLLLQHNGALIISSQREILLCKSLNVWVLNCETCLFVPHSIANSLGIQSIQVTVFKVTTFTLLFTTVYSILKLSQIFTYMSVDSLVEVLVLLDELLHVVWLRGVCGVGSVGLVLGGGRQEGLAGTHPGLSLLAVAVEQLQLQVLVELHTTAYPRPEERNGLSVVYEITN